jgi:hypothetical protein
VHLADGDFPTDPGTTGAFVRSVDGQRRIR